ncbi:MAG: preprotein translocase subunit SecE [Phycisphaerales bacterium]|nr:preprotein translocase subunit SecE [Phycisphaerales bacterium]
MATLDGKTEKRSFFSIYKPGQGMYVRWGTVAGLGLVVLLGAWWLAKELQGFNSVPIQATGTMLWIALGAALTFWLVNKPSFVEFMIMTESEMRKVTWPTRKVTITSTRVVIFLTLLLGAILWLVDFGFKEFFQWCGIL